MLESIKEILFNIGDFFVTIYDFVVGFVNDIVSVVKYTGQAVAQIPQLLEWVNPALIGMLLAAFAVVVIYKILGREG
ncbi:MAG: hypothetical protein IJ424_07290 [Oscillospiraceae bacterium]|nr:hypothetical protein [Oscillospiraceae bacterium]